MQENKQEHFIKNIEIKNFKCFEDFKAEGFGRVNLIGGKNNVGKTAFMEALFFNSSVDESSFESFIKAILSIEIYRDYSLINDMSDLNINAYMKLIISYLKKYMTTCFSSNLNKISISNSKKLEIKLNNTIYSNDDLNFEFMNINVMFSSNFISSVFIDNAQLIHLYDGVKLSRKRDKVNMFINNFDRDIIEYDIIDGEPVCFSKKLNGFVNLSEYGNGLKRYTAFVCAIWSNENGYIFIDEIENGIHYSNLAKLWEVILETSKEANCQIFATTHSKECIKALLTANTENVKTYQPKEHILESEEIKFIELGRTDGKVDSIIFDFDELKNEVEQNMEIRGW